MKIAALLCVIGLSAAFADDIKTTDGKEFKNVTVSRVEADGVVVETDGGIEKIEFAQLSPELQKKYGFDPEKQKALQTQRLLEESKQAEKRQQASAQSAISDSIWKPYTDDLKKYSDNIPSAEVKTYETLKLEYKVVYAVCKQYLDSGIPPEKVKEWVQDTHDRTIATGMPVKLIKLFEGAPDHINLDSTGSDQWVYDGGLFLYVDSKGIVTHWQASTR